MATEHRILEKTVDLFAMFNELEEECGRKKIGKVLAKSRVKEAGELVRGQSTEKIVPSSDDYIKSTGEWRKDSIAILRKTIAKMHVPQKAPQVRVSSQDKNFLHVTEIRKLEPAQDYSVCGRNTLTRRLSKQGSKVRLKKVLRRTVKGVFYLQLGSRDR